MGNSHHLKIFLKDVQVLSIKNRLKA